MAQLKIPVRYYRIYVDPSVECVEKNFGYVEKVLEIDEKKAVLVLVDVWNMHYIDSWIARAAEITVNKIAPVTEAARKAGMTIIHAPSPPVAKKYPQWTKYADDEDLNPPTQSAPEWPPTEFVKRTGEYSTYARRKEPILEAWEERRQAMEIADPVKPEPEDFVIATGDQMNRLLMDRRILHLFYAGFATNMCVQFRDYGMRAMSRRGYNLILIKDATTGVETHDTVDELLMTRVAIRDIEVQLAYSTTSEVFIKACNAVA